MPQKLQPLPHHHPYPLPPNLLHHHPYHNTYLIATQTTKAPTSIPSLPTTTKLISSLPKQPKPLPQYHPYPLPPNLSHRYPNNQSPYLNTIPTHYHQTYLIATQTTKAPTSIPSLPTTTKLISSLPKHQSPYLNTIPTHYHQTYLIATQTTKAPTSIPSLPTTTKLISSLPKQPKPLPQYHPYPLPPNLSHRYPNNQSPYLNTIPTHYHQTYLIATQTTKAPTSIPSLPTTTKLISSLPKQPKPLPQYHPYPLPQHLGHRYPNNQSPYLNTIPAHYHQTYLIATQTTQAPTSPPPLPQPPPLYFPGAFPAIPQSLVIPTSPSQASTPRRYVIGEHNLFHRHQPAGVCRARLARLVVKKSASRRPPRWPSG